MNNFDISIAISILALLVSLSVAAHQILRSRKEFHINWAIARSTLLTKIVKSINSIERTQIELQGLLIYAKNQGFHARAERIAKVRDTAQQILDVTTPSYEALLELESGDQVSLENWRHNFESLYLRVIDLENDVKEIRHSLY